MTISKLVDRKPFQSPFLVIGISRNFREMINKMYHPFLNLGVYLNLYKYPIENEL